jgi:predicted MFS family arabinose efflux permease
VAHVWNWRAAFWVVGLPGLFAAAAALIIHDPGRGASEGHKPAGKADRPKFRDYLQLFRTPSFVFNTAGMAAVAFGTGAYAVWGSTFYQTVRGLNSAQAGIWIGGLTAGAGLIGIALGTALADFLLKFTGRAYLLMASVAVLVAIPFGSFGILDPHVVSSLGLLFVAMILMASVLGPCNTVTANVVPAQERAAGYALNIFLIHLFGDISSPIVVGKLSQLFGRLTFGMMSVFPVLALGSLFFLIGSRHLEEDQRRAREHSGAPAEGHAFH